MTRAMTRFKALAIVAMVGWAAATLPAPAVQPDELLDDPALEERARAISKNLRCLVCRNESIDDSNAPLARDLRLLVRERLSKVLAPYVAAGALRIDDMDLAANQFGELCKGDLFVRSLCGMCDNPTEADIERVVNGAVEMFLARYRA